jgi:hypothetical protein
MNKNWRYTTAGCFFALPHVIGWALAKLKGESCWGISTEIFMTLNLPGLFANVADKCVHQKISNNQFFQYGATALEAGFMSLVITSGNFNQEIYGRTNESIIPQTFLMSTLYAISLKSILSDKNLLDQLYDWCKELFNDTSDDSSFVNDTQ